MLATKGDTSLGEVRGLSIRRSRRRADVPDRVPAFREDQNPL
jgi:hypothetical protein